MHKQPTSKRQQKFVREFDRKLARVLELESYNPEELTPSEYSELLVLQQWFDILDNTRARRFSDTAARF